MALEQRLGASNVFGQFISLDDGFCVVGPLLTATALLWRPRGDGCDGDGVVRRRDTQESVFTDCEGSSSDAPVKFHVSVE